MIQRAAARKDRLYLFGSIMAGLVVWGGIGGLYAYLAELYLEYDEWRVSSEPETLRVTYFDSGCGGHSLVCIPVQFRADTYTIGEVTHSGAGAILALPDGIPCPAETDLAVDGNRFVLTGFHYQGRETNIFTGDTRDVASFRFDLVSWEVETPYAVSGSLGKVGRQTPGSNATAPVRYEFRAGNHGPERFPPTSPDRYPRHGAVCLENDHVS